jgi:hypothetical protein
VSAGRRGPALLRIEARRPAAWIALVAAAGAGLAGSMAAAPLMVAVGGLLAVAAIGHPPSGVGVFLPRRWLPLAVGRGLWPVAGAMLAAIWLALRDGPMAAVAAGSVAGGAAASAALVAALIERGTIEGVAASQTLAAIGAAAAAGLAAAVAGGSLAAQGAATAVVWIAAAGGLLAGQAHDRQPALGPSSARHRRPIAGAGPAMASALAGMAGCYFLAPQYAWAYAPIAVGWFVALALPAATSSAGSAAAVRLVRSAAGRPAAPGTWPRAAPLVAKLAGLLGWPAVVAAVLTGSEAGRAGGPLTALAALAGAALLAVVAAALAARGGAARSIGEVARALALVAVAAGAVTAASWAARAPHAPGLPGFWPGDTP